MHLLVITSTIILCVLFCDSKYLSDMRGHISELVEKSIKTVVCNELRSVIAKSKEATRGGSSHPVQHSFDNVAALTALDETPDQSRDRDRGRRLEIGELAQLAVNAMYLERSCTFFETELATEDDMNFADKKEESEMGTIALHLGGDGMRIPKMHGARDGLEAVMSECVNALFERLNLCVDDILRKYIPRINWMSDKINRLSLEMMP